MFSESTTVLPNRCVSTTGILHYRKISVKYCYPKLLWFNARPVVAMAINWRWSKNGLKKEALIFFCDRTSDWEKESSNNKNKEKCSTSNLKYVILSCSNENSERFSKMLQFSLERWFFFVWAKHWWRALHWKLVYCSAYVTNLVTYFFTEDWIYFCVAEYFIQGSWVAHTAIFLQSSNTPKFWFWLYINDVFHSYSIFHCHCWSFGYGDVYSNVKKLLSFQNRY